MKNRDEVVSILGRDVSVCDSTLMAGELAPGVIFSDIEKYRIAKMLDDAGVPQIECGMPAMGEDERRVVKHIANMGLKASVSVWSRALAQEVELCMGCDADSICLSMSTSDVEIESKLKKSRIWVIEQIKESVQLAKENGMYVICAAEDASRAELMFLIEFAKAAKEAGADRIRYCDTIGREDPFTTMERVSTIKNLVGIDVEIASRNDFGMATANSLAAIKGGARFVCSTMLGIGERAGYTATEEIVMSAEKLISKRTGINTTALKPLAEFIARTIDVPIAPNKPFMGSSCFAYETGMFSEPQRYEPYEPECIGVNREIVIGKRSGIKMVASLLMSNGIEIDRETAEKLTIAVRRAVTENHRSLTAEEVMFLYNDLKNGVNTFE